MATTKAGSAVSTIPHFDRSMHVRFRCPVHGNEFISKDPYESHWFLLDSEKDCPPECQVRADDMVLVHDYPSS